MRDARHKKQISLLEVTAVDGLDKSQDYFHILAFPFIKMFFCHNVWIGTKQLISLPWSEQQK